MKCESKIRKLMLLTYVVLKVREILGLKNETLKVIVVTEKLETVKNRIRHK